MHHAKTVTRQRAQRPMKAGVSAPPWLWDAVEAERKRVRSDLDSRSAAVAEAMQDWVNKHRLIAREEAA